MTNEQIDRAQDDAKLAVTCTECGGPQGTTNYTGGIGEEMKANGWCFTCHFWQKYVKAAAEKDQHAVVVQREDGTRWHYYIAPETASRFGRGFGGSKFVVKFLDGRVVETTNLWCQADIPANFYDRIPVNATFSNA